MFLPLSTVCMVFAPLTVAYRTREFTTSFVKSRPHLLRRDILTNNLAQIKSNTSAPFTPGPISAKLSNLGLLVQSILSTQPWARDPRVVEIPWRADHYDAVTSKARAGGLVFGILLNDGVVTPSPPVIRALKEAKACLEATGHEVCHL